MRAFASKSPSQTPQSPGRTRELDPRSSGVGQVLASPGRELEPTLRGDMERRFGHDFSRVRVHTDARAAESARALSARAYTVGRHVVFAERQFDPSVEGGRRLLAHELAHTIQQDVLTGAEPPLQRRLTIEPPGTSLERAAEESATRGTGNSQLAPLRRVSLQRQPAPSTQAARPKLESVFKWFEKLRQLPEYIDNDIKEVNFFTAELAHIHYKNGSLYKLGLVPKYMEPPVVEVDYRTPRQEIRPVEDIQGQRFGFMIESEMKSAPPTMPYKDLLAAYTHWVDFYDVPPGLTVPSRINHLTAPTLCAVLLDSERRWEELVGMAVQIGLGGTIAIGGYAGAGGIPKPLGLAGTTTRAVATAGALSPTARTLAREMDALLAKGGTKTLEAEGVKLVDVEVSMQGSVLAVRRFESKLPEVLRGQGIGTRVTAEFEKAAAEVGRLNGAKTVTIDVGVIINPGWREILEARGYVFIREEGRWVKTIQL